MPKVSRSRTVAAPPDRVWALVDDPYSLPRWWPRTTRVEDVTGEGARRRWTAVLETDRGSIVRADFRGQARTSGERFAWEQLVAGTPFERILKSASVEVRLRPQGEDTRVELTSSEALKGMSRLGATMVRTAAKKRLDEALDGLEYALVGGA